MIKIRIKEEQKEKEEINKEINQINKENVHPL